MISPKKLISCSRCTKKFSLDEGKKINFASNIFYICKECLPTLKNCKSKISPFKWDYFCSPCEWFGFVDEAKYSNNAMSCPICKNKNLELNDEIVQV